MNEWQPHQVRQLEEILRGDAGIETLLESVEVDPQRRSGLPVLWGTGFTVSQVLAELAESTGVVEVAGNFDLDPGTIRNMLNGLSLMFQRPYSK